MVPKKSILIIDDHPLFREGLKSVIGRDSRFIVVGETGTAREALRLVKKLNPDLALVDMCLPDQSGIYLTWELKGISPETRIMMVTMHSKVKYIIKAFLPCASGYVGKESAMEKLLKGVEAVLKGEYFMDSHVSHKVIEKLMNTPEEDGKISDAAYETLSSREQEVMVLLSEGLTAKQIADKLFISPKTTENHRSNILRKLDLTAPWNWFDMPHG